MLHLMNDRVPDMRVAWPRPEFEARLREEGKSYHIYHPFNREEITDFRHVIPAVQFAVDAYVNFARRAPWQEAACSSLTELFAPDIHRQRLATWPEHYPWIQAEGLQYFRNRVTQARRDVEQGLDITLTYFNTFALQKRALDILKFKLDILWAMNDAMAMKYGVNT